MMLIVEGYEQPLLREAMLGLDHAFEARKHAVSIWSAWRLVVARH